MHWSLLFLGSTLAAPIADFTLRDHRGILLWILALALLWTFSHRHEKSLS